MMPQFASPLIRNGATLGGNLGTGSPIGDAPPVLLALEAAVVLASVEGERTVPLAEYFTGYRESVRRPGELITEVVVPLPASGADGVPQDRQAAVRRHLQRRGRLRARRRTTATVRKARIGLGGVAATPVRALATEAALEGRPWTPRPSTRRPRCWRARAPRSATSGPARSTASAMLGQSLRKLWAERARR